MQLKYINILAVALWIANTTKIKLGMSQEWLEMQYLHLKHTACIDAKSSRSNPYLPKPRDVFQNRHAVSIEAKLVDAV